MTSAVGSPTPDQAATIGGLTVNAHDHLCVLYRGETERDDLMVDFLAEGVQSGHKSYCMIAPTQHQRIEAAVTARRDDVRAVGDSQAEGRLEFVAPDASHMSGGGFVSDRMLEFWDDWGVATYERDGVGFARIGADMSWAKPQAGAGFVMDLARYETRFNLWAIRYPQVTICMYDLDEFGGDVIIPIIKAHPKVWMSGVVLVNPYYLESDYFLAEEVDGLAGRASPR
jgi:hypothetical protein